MTTTDMKQKIWQCAWCRCIMLDGVKVKEAQKILEMSHGICPSCGETILKKYLNCIHTGSSVSVTAPGRLS